MSVPQDNSYAARLRFIRGKIAMRNPSSVSLVSPGIQNPHSAFLTKLDGKLVATYKALTPSGEPITAPGCCSECRPVCPIIAGENEISLFYHDFDTNTEDQRVYPQYFKDNINSFYGTEITLPAIPSDSSFFMTVYYPSLCNVTNRTITVVDGNGDDVTNTTTTTFDLGLTQNSDYSGGVIIIFFNAFPVADSAVTFTASNECSATSDDAEFYCFLAGTPVSMADGTTKPIETVAVGDRVLGAFGEINTVTGLQDHPLRFGTISNINGEHKTTSHHPHVSPDHRALCVSPAVVTSFAYGKHYMVTGADGKKERRLLKGLSRDRVGKLEVGMELQTLTGPRTVTTIEHVPMPPSTPVYHLAVNGSHTYVVDGYAVYGWADETDFDYDTWTPKA